MSGALKGLLKALTTSKAHVVEHEAVEVDEDMLDEDGFAPPGFQAPP